MHHYQYICIGSAQHTCCITSDMLHRHAQSRCIYSRTYVPITSSHRSLSFLGPPLTGWRINTHHTSHTVTLECTAYSGCKDCSSFCLRRLASLNFKIRVSGTHSSHLANARKQSTFNHSVYVCSCICSPCMATHSPSPHHQRKNVHSPHALFQNVFSCTSHTGSVSRDASLHTTFCLAVVSFVLVTIFFCASYSLCFCIFLLHWPLFFICW